MGRHVLKVHASCVENKLVGRVKAEEVPFQTSDWIKSSIKPHGIGFRLLEIAEVGEGSDSSHGVPPAFTGSSDG